MKKFLLTLTVMLAVCACGCSKIQGPTTETNAPVLLNSYEKILKNGEIKIATVSNSKPMSFKDAEGDYKGFEIDLGREIAKRILGKPELATFIETSSAGRIEIVDSGKADIVIATTTINPQRKIFVDFTNPYYTASLAILAPAESKVFTVADLQDKKIGVVAGTTSEKSAKTLAPNATIIARETFNQSTDDLITKNVDVVFQDDALILGFLQDHKSEYKMLPLKLTVEPYGIAVKRTEDKTLRNSIDLILDEMRSDGTLAQLKQKWKI